MQNALTIDTRNLIAGLCRFAYTPTEAVCAIIDNAIDAGARNVGVFIKKREIKGRDTLRNNVSEYLIIDDGRGMNEEGILNALTLGASDAYYSPHSLSKFGLGLKSAAFSQGDELDVISSPGDGAPFLKYQVSLPSITDTYFATKLELSAEDQELLAKYLPEGHGTLVRVGAVRREGHPAVKETLLQLRGRIGVIYYYFLLDGVLTIKLEDQVVPAFDVLFTAEADANGNLDEATWNGRETRWIQRPKSLLLDNEFKVRGIIEATQLPHPPTFAHVKPGGDKELRDKYLITAKNYGFYIYRNKRLITWADSIDGLIGYNQDLYSFRGRILLDDSADNAFNIDVKKTSLVMSDDAKETLKGPTNEYKRKSVRAWDRAKQLLKQAESTDPHKQSNDLAEQLKTPDTLPGQPLLPPAKEAEIDEELTRRMQANIQLEMKQAAEMAATSNLPGPTATDVPPKTEQQQFEETLKGESGTPYATKIFRNESLRDNQLWEPYYDAEHDYCVRINRYHRFAKLLFEQNSRNPDLQVLFELFLHQFAIAEVQFRRQFEALFPSLNINSEKVDKITSEFRRYVADNLTLMCVQLDDKLPRTE